MNKTELKQIIADKDAEIEELTKKLSTAEYTSDLWYKGSQEGQNVIEEMHSIFDGIEGVQERYVEKRNSWGGKEQHELSLQARLISFMQTLIKP